MFAEKRKTNDSLPSEQLSNKCIDKYTEFQEKQNQIEVEKLTRRSLLKQAIKTSVLLSCDINKIPDISKLHHNMKLKASYQERRDVEV